jgi:hypothetical protein
MKKTAEDARVGWTRELCGGAPLGVLLPALLILVITADARALGPASGVTLGQTLGPLTTPMRRRREHGGRIGQRRVGGGAAGGTGSDSFHALPRRAPEADLDSQSCGVACSHEARRRPWLLRLGPGASSVEATFPGHTGLECVLRQASVDLDGRQTGRLDHALETLGE